MNEPQRRGRGRPVGSRDSYKRRAPVASAIERRLGEIAVLLAELNRRHRNEHESLPPRRLHLETFHRLDSKFQAMGLGTGNGWGGARPGAGRRKGTKDKRPRKSASALARISAAGRELPLDRLMRRMNDETEPERYRDSLAMAAAPYLHPRLSVVGQAKTPFEMTSEELDATIARFEMQLRERDGQARLTLAVNNERPRDAD